MVGPRGWGTFDPAEDRSRSTSRRGKSQAKARTAPEPVGPITEQLRLTKKLRKAEAHAQREAAVKARKLRLEEERTLNKVANEARLFLNQQAIKKVPLSKAETEKAERRAVKKKEKMAAAAAERAARKVAASKVVVEYKKDRGKRMQVALEKRIQPHDCASLTVRAGAPKAGVLTIDGIDYRISRVVVRKSE